MSARKKVLALALSLGLVATGVMSYSAFADHVRPKGATPDRDSLVVAYDPCTSPTATHDGAISVGSCPAPTKVSDWLTVGTPDNNGAVARMRGFVKNTVINGDPTTAADEADVVIHAEVTDIRCTPALESSAPSLCSDANTAGGPDYAGTLALQSGITLTDHRNDDTSTTGFDNDSATTFPLPVPPLPFSCSPTAGDPGRGSNCSITITADTVAGTLGVELAKENTRAIWKGASPYITDGGDDGDVNTTPNETFLVEGLFVP